MKLAALTEALVAVSAKAARIARTMRAEQALFSLIIEEKTGDEKNKRFVQDFKTLGDVLVQEMVRHDITKQFSGLSGHIHGEESNAFTNTLGETVTMSIQPTQEETIQLLAKVLNGNTKAAQLLAEVAHSDVEVEKCPGLETVKEEVADDIGIWIDPIDSTAQYISGHEGSAVDGIHSEGLQCVVVIIGVYHRSSGLPVIGVCHQPFYRQDHATKQWSGRCIWGISYLGTQVHHIPDLISADTRSSLDSACVVMSSSEQHSIQGQLAQKFTVRHAAGAGYKLLCVIDGRAAGYVLSVGSTFKWDTCGPHAILLALGGDVLSYTDACKKVPAWDVELELSAFADCRLRYSDPDSGDRPEGEKWSNSTGLIAYVDCNDLVNIVQCLT